jgi:hypothetical protein
MRNLPTYESFVNEAYAYDIKRGLKHIKFLLSNPLMYKTPFYISFKKGTDEKEVEALVKSAESESKDVAKMPRSYGKGPYGELTLELEKPNYPGLTWVFKALDEFYGNNGASMGWFGDIEESEDLELDEKFLYPEGVKTTGDKILDKTAKLLNSPSSIITIGTGSLRGQEVPFMNGKETFLISVYRDMYTILCKNGEWEIDRKDIKSAEELFNQIEKAIQLGKPSVGREKK